MSAADRHLLIQEVLPQTQCTRCSYPDCEAYAKAIANQEAAINQCPPGGQLVIDQLAALTGQAPEPLNPAYGVHGPLQVAVIDESWCIGCTLCIKACPVDAIMGSNKHMHTVIEKDCTGCELCIKVCPVDCITLIGAASTEWTQAHAGQARLRYENRKIRLKKEEQAHRLRLENKALMKYQSIESHSLHTDPEILEKKKRIIEQVLAKARAPSSVKK